MAIPPALIIPAAGRGSRFGAPSYDRPKPLIDLMGKPFIWWAAESVLRAVTVRDIVVVIRTDHADRFGLDAAIRAHIPAARIVVIERTTSGAAETAAIGVEALAGDGPIIINDCDHAFDAPGLGALLGKMPDAQGGLLGFRSTNPAYSYAEIDASGRVVRTAEKRAISPFAIAGCYLFAGRSVFTSALQDYRRTCPYPELFLSGLYDTLIGGGGTVLFHELAGHIAFGTPDEYHGVTAARLGSLWPHAAAA